MFVPARDSIRRRLRPHGAQQGRPALPRAREFRKLRIMSKSRGPGARRPRTVSATYAAKSFGRLVDMVRTERARYVVERGGTAVAEIVPVATGACTVADVVDLLGDRDRLSEAYLREVEAGVASLNRPSPPGDPWES